MISRIDHVSIAVADYPAARRFFQDLLGAVPGASATDGDMQFFWQIFSWGDLSRLELMTPTDSGGLLENFLKNKAGGVHHITLQTPDLEAAKRYLEQNQIPYFGEHHFEGEYWKEIFIHPKHAFGVLIQISEFAADDWLAPGEKFPRGRKWAVRNDGESLQLETAHPGGGKARLDLSPDEARALARELERAADQ